MKLLEIAKEVMPTVKTYSPKEIAEKHGVSVKSIEAQLKDGIEHEKEHSTKNKTAREIALDHLWEDPKYYTKLEKMEGEH